MKTFLLASLLTVFGSVAFASSTMIIITFTGTSTDVTGNGTTNSQASTFNGEPLRQSPESPTNFWFATISTKLLMCLPDPSIIR